MMNNKPVDEALNNLEEAFEITLLNKENGVTYPDAPVYSGNSMEQLLSEYAADIGINPNDKKILFINKRTGADTADRTTTVGKLGLEPGDVLAIIGNAGVA